MALGTQVDTYAGNFAGKHYEYDDILLEFVGECGKYQKIMVLFTVTFHLFGAFNNLGTVFIAGTPEHWCAVPELNNLNLTYDTIRNLTIPLEEDRGETVFSSCQMYERNYSGWSLDEVDDCLAKGCNNDVEKVPCSDGWTYSQEQYKSSVVSEFDLVCDRKYLATLQVSFYTTGLLFGVFFSGILSDMYGRLPVTIGTFVGMNIAMIWTAFAHNYIIYGITRFLAGFFTIANFTTALVLGVELVGPRYRVHAVMGYEYMWSIGYIIFAGVAYLIRNWKVLQLVTSLPCLLLGFSFLVMPESPRWLYAKQRKEKADKIMTKMARVNKTTFPSGLNIVIQSKKKATILDILRTPNIRIRSMIQFYIWFVTSCVYFGLAFGTNNLAGNNYLNFFIAGALEIPAYALSSIALGLIGRRYTLCSVLMLGGLSLLATIPVPNSHRVVATTLSMIGKFGVSASFATIYVFTPELYPTSLRNVGLGTASFFARVGGIIAPFFWELMEFGFWIPPTIMGVLTVLAGLLALRLPETRNMKMPETVEEAENFGYDNAMIVSDNNLSTKM